MKQFFILMLFVVIFSSCSGGQKAELTGGTTEQNNSTEGGAGQNDLEEDKTVNIDSEFAILSSIVSTNNYSCQIEFEMLNSNKTYLGAYYIPGANTDAPYCRHTTSTSASSFSGASNYCRSLDKILDSKGWRVPNYDEMLFIFSHLDKIKVVGLDKSANMSYLSLAKNNGEGFRYYKNSFLNYENMISGYRGVASYDVIEDPKNINQESFYFWTSSLSSTEKEDGGGMILLSPDGKWISSTLKDTAKDTASIICIKDPE